MKIIALFILSFLFAPMVRAQSPAYAWAKSFGGSHVEVGNAVAVDGNGNVFITGHFQDTADFDPGPGVYNLIAGPETMFIAKLDSAGNFLWAHQFGNQSYPCHGTDIAVDAAGNVYTTGYFWVGVDFDPSPSGVFVLTSGTAFNPAPAPFVFKLDAAGNFVWAKKISGNSNVVNAIALDASGNVYTAGALSDNFTFNNPYVCKMDALGNEQWLKILAGNNTNPYYDAGHDWAAGIGVDSSGNVYTVGRFQDTIDIDPGPGTFYLFPTPLSPNNNGIGNEFFISKLDAQGAFVWGKAFGDTYTDEALDVAVDKAGNVYTAGYFADTVDFDPGPGVYRLGDGLGQMHGFISKLDATGNFQWAKMQRSLASVISSRSIVLDTAGSVYTTGNFNSADFDPGPATFSLGPNGSAFVSKLNSDGDFQWAVELGSAGSQAQGEGITVDASGNVYTTGLFTQSGDFNPGAAVNTLITAGSFDCFVSKLRQLPVPFIHTQPTAQTICAGTPNTFSISAINAASYQWRKDGVAISGATTALYTIPFTAPADQGSYDVVVALAGAPIGLSTISNTVALTINKNHWAGSLGNTAWTNPANWQATCGVPTSTSYVQIPASAPSMPTISTTVNIWQLTSLGTINVSTGGSLNILGQ